MSVAAASSRPAPAAHLAPLRYESVAATHAGCVRPTNEDACLNLPDIGLWAVADGMGGHSAGALASRRVVDQLGDVASFESAFAFRRAVGNALREANTSLQIEASRAMLDTIGATVVTFLAHGSHYACLWAGDSRAYLWRAGRLQRLTHDHTLAAELVDGGGMSRTEVDARNYSHVVTRAVGARPQLEIDCVYGAIQPGDRFLLCSDGLAVLNDTVIAGMVGVGKPADTSCALIRAALGRNVSDNVTVITIEASRL